MGRKKIYIYYNNKIRYIVGKLKKKEKELYEIEHHKKKKV
jgi:hypothetical protein